MLTTSTHRQRAAAAVAKYIEHVDHVADEVHEEPHEPVTYCQSIWFLQIVNPYEIIDCQSV